MLREELDEQYEIEQRRMESPIYIQIEKILPWGAVKRIETKNGPRNLQKALPDEKFWEIWRDNKDSLKKAGLACSKDKESGYWEICWWKPLEKEEILKMEASQKASQATSSNIDIPCPNGLKFIPYQKAGIEYALNRQNVLIGDEMGLGKTPQSVGIYNVMNNNLAKNIKCLVVCPASLRINWKREFERWSTKPIRIGIVKNGKEYPENWDVLIINYDVLSKHRQKLQTENFDLMIVDECHYLKNPKSLRAKALFGDKKEEKKPIQAKRKVFLSGTPICNRPIELWPIVEALDPEGLGQNFFSFAKKYCDAKRIDCGSNGMRWDFTGASNLDQLQRLLRQNIMVRRLKKDVLKELPPKRRQILEIPANGSSNVVRKEQKAIKKHKDLLLELQIEVELSKAESQETYNKAVEAMEIEVSVSFEEMAAARKNVALAKVEKVVEHLQSALEEGPVVCFAHHKEVIKKISEKFNCVTLTGETKMEDRQKAVDRFQNGEVDLFLGNIKAAGVGITLTRSSHVVFAEIDWTPSNLSQCEDRCHRISQKNSVLVQHIVLEGSLDALMAQKVIKKQEIIDKALDKGVQKIKFEEPIETFQENTPVTKNLTPEIIENLALDVSEELKETTLRGLQILSGVCDGAKSEDGIGFNGADTGIGKSLAMRKFLTPKQTVLGIKILKKYHRQLPKYLSKIINK